MIELVLAVIPEARPPFTLDRWPIDFRPFSLLHVLSVVLFGGAIVVLCRLGLKWQSDGRERKLRIGWGVFALAWQLTEIAWWLLPGHFTLAKSLPLHLCDLAALLVPLVLITQWRPFRTMLYFWGIGLSTQAFFTPVLTDGEGFATIRYWHFWVGHTHIVGAAFYDVIVRRYRPAWPDFATAVFVSLSYVAVVLPLNILLVENGANYGYVGPLADEKQPPTIVKLGHWPGRIYVMMAVVAAGYVALTLPWRFLERRARNAGAG